MKKGYPLSLTIVGIGFFMLLFGVICMPRADEILFIGCSYMGLIFIIVGMFLLIIKSYYQKKVKE